MSSLRPIFSCFTMLAASAFSIAAFPDVASACSCAFSERIAPSATDKNVPTNTKIWSSGSDCTDPVLQKMGGATVALTITKIGFVTVLQPNAELELGSTYEVMNCNTFGAPSTFTVTEGPDTTPPPAPKYALGEVQSSGGELSSCGEELYVPLEGTFEGALLVLDIAGRSTLDTEKLNGNTVDTFFREDTPLVGNAICGPNNWDFDKDGDAIGTRLGAFDLAGNFSGMTPAQTVEAGCACSTVGASSTNGYGSAFAALTLLGLARIRSKKR